MNANLTVGLLSCGPYHIYSGEECTSGKMQAVNQSMKPCWQQMNLCLSAAAASPQRPTHPLSGLHQLAPALLTDYRQSKPRVTELLSRHASCRQRLLATLSQELENFQLLVTLWKVCYLSLINSDTQLMVNDKGQETRTKAMCMIG